MNTLDLAARLDARFSIPSCEENLVEWAVTGANREHVYQEFLDRRTGLMLLGDAEVERVLTSVFVTDRIVEKLNTISNCLLFTHHHFDYFEDERGLQPISPAHMERIVAKGNSLYVAHAPLDTDPEYGTSVSLAKFVGLSIDERFYDYYGQPTGVIAHTERTSFDEFVSRVRITLARPVLTLEPHSAHVEKIAVVAGGGDLPDLLQMVYDRGCDTLLTGTVENRWQVPWVQDANRQFRALNRELGISLVGGTHFGTERPAMLSVLRLFEGLNVSCDYCEDPVLLHAA